MMMDEDILREAQEIAKNIINAEFKPFDQLVIPNKQGIYVIKETSNKFFENRIFYVGKASNLLRRLTIDYFSKKAEIYYRLKLNMPNLNIKNFITKECTFSIQEIDDYDMNALIEMLLIAILRKRGEPLINNLT